MTTTTSGADYELSAGAADRQQRLATAIRQIRTRAGASDPARPLLILGVVLAPLGLVLIIMGWWGAAHTARLFEQIPYSISGGMLGLALVFAGGFAYFAYWLTQLVHVARQDAARTGDTLDRIEALLSEFVAARDTNGSAPAPARARGRSGGSGAASGGGRSFVATPHGTMFHRADCAAVAGQAGLRKVTPSTPGLNPCKICQPLDQ